MSAEKGGHNVTRRERALQVWQVLVGAAHHRQVLTYEILAGLIGMGPEGKGAGTLSQTLRLIMRYCERNNLPPVTALVVNKRTGQPGKGLTSVRELHADREKVFSYKWFQRRPPHESELL